VRLREITALEGLAELVIEALGPEIAFLLRDPFVEAEVRRNEKFGHSQSPPENDRKDKREVGNP
jgi:hypothetical protein